MWHEDRREYKDDKYCSDCGVQLKGTVTKMGRYRGPRICKDKKYRCVGCLQYFFAKNKYIAGRLKHLRQNYGITPQTFEDMLKAQNGLCRLCGKPEYTTRRFCVDHDHKTGKIRALLCDPCNTGLGQFQDDPQLLAKAIEYLNTYKVLE